MQIGVERESEETFRYQTYGFRRGVGFEPSSIEYDQAMEMTLDFEEQDDREGAEDLDEKDLDTENTWPSRRRTKGSSASSLARRPFEIAAQLRNA